MTDLDQKNETVFHHELEYNPSRSLVTMLIGKPLSTSETAHQTIGKTIGLAVFASDALSSMAYSTQEMMMILAAAGTAAFGFTMPITLCIVALLAILTLSYEQTIHAYPDGGGAYIVARDNLGDLPAMTAAAALLTDYILTVAVSISSGVAQFTSVFPELYPHRVAISIGFVLLVMVINLRGVKESGTTFAIPTYIFLFSIIIMVGSGVYQFLTGTLGVVQNPPPLEHEGAFAAVTTFLILKAFASGTTALTGVEAISNGITAFKEPRSKNAGQTLVIMAFLLGTLLLGVAFLSYRTGVIPSELEANISQVARTVFHSKNIFYLITVGSTMLILIMAANTAFADYPRLSAMLGRDGFLPRQFSWRGSRLVFSRGIIFLALMACALIIFFQASVNRLIPLYAVGVFVSFTLSQFGMAKRWHNAGKMKEGEEIHGRGSTLKYDRHWLMKMFMNGFGAFCTLIISLIFGVTKFTSGAWFVLILTPVLVFLFSMIHSHYQGIRKKLSLRGGEKAGSQINRHRVILLVSGVHQCTMKALRYARTISDDITAVHVAVDPQESEKIQSGWQEWGDGYRLSILESPYRHLIEPLVAYIETLLERLEPNEVVTVIVPQFVSKNPATAILHARAADTLRKALIHYPNVVITEVPYDIDDL
ncbi:APC family permease [Flexilinea flocculi]|jgi:amino acid transporter|uniref:Amino acid/polyamine/organocation transporter, APC superfamily n=1 Tax=Flexilinea flocculi TaxID=1678840 RepID=A0A0S7BMZ5_9CHLR|nr:APC family permease [Flexilinea flocculi]NMB94443.1 APC family permease [Flexilinea flocculi]GAP41861.1 amino acid/polyamine/organocation transporter, APC superfamily [Flexilinea flocculi]